MEPLLEELDIPVIVVDGPDWTVRLLNRCARLWMGAREGEPLRAFVPGLDRERLLARIAKGREARFEHRTLCAPSFAAQYFCRPRPDGSVLVEGRSGSALEESEAMLASYSLLIEKQKRELEQEKQRVERVLLNILPPKTIEQLRMFGRAIPERFENVSVLFLDIVDFTAISRDLSPDELFAELNDLFTAFDDIVTHYGCERIKTIGDAYLAVAGLPEPNPAHAPAIVSAAMAMRGFLEHRNARSRRQWTCRIGVHSGTVTAGVIGRLKYIYDIFGDGVNTASRMEGHCDPMQINLSVETRDLLDESFAVASRGLIEVKGKGPLEMFYVERAPFDASQLERVISASDNRSSLLEAFREL